MHLLPIPFQFRTHPLNETLLPSFLGDPFEVAFWGSRLDIGWYLHSVAAAKLDQQCKHPVQPTRGSIECLAHCDGEKVLLLQPLQLHGMHFGSQQGRGGSSGEEANT